jgi:hypothetical protein
VAVVVVPVALPHLGVVTARQVTLQVAVKTLRLTLAVVVVVEAPTIVRFLVLEALALS